MTKEEYFFKHPKDNTSNVLDNLINMFGQQCTLAEAQSKYELEKKCGYVCPKCKGKGYLVREYNSYPSGLPDSGWVYEPGYDYSECDLCHGNGRTDKKFIPKTKIIGYEAEE